MESDYSEGASAARAKRHRAVSDPTVLGRRRDRVPVSEHVPRAREGRARVTSPARMVSSMEDLRYDPDLRERVASPRGRHRERGPYRRSLSESPDELEYIHRSGRGRGYDWDRQEGQDRHDRGRHEGQDNHGERESLQDSIVHQWTERLETMLDKFNGRVDRDKWIYNEMIAKAKWWDNFLIIISAAISGLVGVEGLVVVFSDAEPPLWLEILATTLSFIAGIILTLANTWKPSEVAANALTTRVKLLAIKHKIDLVLSIAPRDRPLGEDFVRDVTSEFESACLSAPVPYSDIVKRAKKRFPGVEDVESRHPRYDIGAQQPTRGRTRRRIHMPTLRRQGADYAKPEEERYYDQADWYMERQLSAQPDYEGRYSMAAAAPVHCMLAIEASPDVGAAPDKSESPVAVERWEYLAVGEGRPVDESPPVHAESPEIRPAESPPTHAAELPRMQTAVEFLRSDTGGSTLSPRHADVPQSPMRMSVPQASTDDVARQANRLEHMQAARSPGSATMWGRLMQSGQQRRVVELGHRGRIANATRLLRGECRRSAMHIDSPRKPDSLTDDQIRQAIMGINVAKAVHPHRDGNEDLAESREPYPAPLQEVIVVRESQSRESRASAAPHSQVGSTTSSRVARRRAASSGQRPCTDGEHCGSSGNTADEEFSSSSTHSGTSFKTPPQSPRRSSSSPPDTPPPPGEHMIESIV